MQVIIRDFECQQCVYDVKETDNVEILKAMIEFKTGITRCSYRLTYRGQMLEVGHKIGDYNITNHSIIDMILM
uniref:Ubiquitin-like domain-containing protein n=1 Tax=Meloidogyne enterolobii TaxID=390850 RepID=A0A6V7VYT0_MELEN|nr:unnamed protein product [Meloidogyne enterolobii]